MPGRFLFLGEKSETSELSEVSEVSGRVGESEISETSEVSRRVGGSEASGNGGGAEGVRDSEGFGGAEMGCLAECSGGVGIVSGIFLGGFKSCVYLCWR